ncbi:MAG TPA: DUF6364 family protein [Candidatus Hodarchaeales archaeon]|nr:DUF6364 family protein [Candidatus Hodarchaeales archaeon]
MTKTTVMLPETLLQKARYYAVHHRTSLSQIVREGLSERMKKGQPEPASQESILSLTGTLDLGGKQPPPRAKLYEKHLKHKLGV